MGEGVLGGGWDMSCPWPARVKVYMCRCYAPASRMAASGKPQMEDSCGDPQPHPCWCGKPFDYTHLALLALHTVHVAAGAVHTAHATCSGTSEGSCEHMG